MILCHQCLHMVYWLIGMCIELLLNRLHYKMIDELGDTALYFQFNTILV